MGSEANGRQSAHVAIFAYGRAADDKSMRYLRILEDCTAAGIDPPPEVRTYFGRMTRFDEDSHRFQTRLGDITFFSGRRDGPIGVRASLDWNGYEDSPQVMTEVPRTRESGEEATVLELDFRLLPGVVDRVIISPFVMDEKS